MTMWYKIKSWQQQSHKNGGEIYDTYRFNKINCWRNQRFTKENEKGGINLTDVLKNIPTEVLLAEVKFREMKENEKTESEYLTTEDVQKIYGYKSYKSAYNRIKEDGERDKKYVVIRSKGNSGKLLVERKSFMEFLNGGKK